MATTQAVVLARGLGTRMRRVDGSTLDLAQASAADAGAKGMMPVAGAQPVGVIGVAPGRPFIEYVLSALADAGVTEVVLVVGAEHSTIREYLTRTAVPQRVAVRFAVQDQPRGTADAVFSARDAIRNAPFLVTNSDTYYSPHACGLAAAIGANGLVAYEADALVRDSGIEPDRVLRYALLDIAADDTLRAIREKPARDDPLALASERWVSMNLWTFTPAIFDACERVRPSARGELELQDAVTIAMRDLGVVFRVARVREGVLDLSQRSDVAIVSTRLADIVPRA